MTENESAIEQINLGFNEQEDRLLLKVGLADKTEVAVWISRRVTKQIWGALQQAGNTLLPNNPASAAPAPSPALDKNLALDRFMRDAEQAQKIAPLDFQSAYLNNRQARSEAPLLAIVCLTVSVGNLPPYMELQCSNGQSVKMVLTGELIHALTSMLQLASREANWDLAMASLVQPSSSPSNKQALH